MESSCINTALSCEHHADIKNSAICSNACPIHLKALLDEKGSADDKGSSIVGATLARMRAAHLQQDDGEDVGGGVGHGDDVGAQGVRGQLRQDAERR